MKTRQKITAELCFLSLTLLCAGARVTSAQQTIFNVPSADVLDKGTRYVEYDAVIGNHLSSTSTPRSVNGFGHGIEAGTNFPSFNTPTPGTIAAVPNLKWAFYQNPKHGLTLFGGDGVWLPLKRATYGLGNNAFLGAAKTFGPKIRVAAGAYDYSRGTIDPANRAGAFASVEETVNARLGLAVDWYSGNNSAGYITPGASYKVTSRLTAIAGYQVGNHDVTNGNRSCLFILGWTPRIAHKTE